MFFTIKTIYQKMKDMKKTNNSKIERWINFKILLNNNNKI